MKKPAPTGGAPLPKPPPPKVMPKGGAAKAPRNAKAQLTVPKKMRLLFVRTAGQTAPKAENLGPIGDFPHRVGIGGAIDPKAAWKKASDAVAIEVREGGTLEAFGTTFEVTRLDVVATGGREIDAWWRLRAMGYLVSDHAFVDVMRFQMDRKLRPTGVLDDKTKKATIDAYRERLDAFGGKG